MLITSVLLLPPNTTATETPKSSSTETIETVASKDTYVDESAPTANYGWNTELYIGGFGGEICEAYYYFEFTDKPADYTKAEISVYIWDIKETEHVDVYLIMEDWDEYTLNWQNKPTKNVKITTIQFEKLFNDDFYLIDVSNFIVEKTNISICISTIPSDDLIMTISREKETGFYDPIFGIYWYTNMRPTLIWTHEVSESDDDDDDDDKPKPPPDIPLGDFYLVFTAIGIISLTIIYYKKFYRKSKL